MCAECLLAQECVNFKNMNKNQCPKCYNDFEARETSPCFVCGCWLSGKELKKAISKSDFSVYGLADGSEITLCKFCYVEEILANQGCLLDELGIRKEEAQSGVRFLEHAVPIITKDKYCADCAQRLSLLKVTQ